MSIPEWCVLTATIDDLRKVRPELADEGNAEAVAMWLRPKRFRLSAVMAYDYSPTRHETYISLTSGVHTVLGNHTETLDYFFLSGGEGG